MPSTIRYHRQHSDTGLWNGKCDAGYTTWLEAGACRGKRKSDRKIRAYPAHTTEQCWPGRKRGVGVAARLHAEAYRGKRRSDRKAEGISRQLR